MYISMDKGGGVLKILLLNKKFYLYSEKLSVVI